MKDIRRPVSMHVLEAYRQPWMEQFAYGSPATPIRLSPGLRALTALLSFGIILGRIGPRRPRRGQAGNRNHPSWRWFS